MKPHRYGANDFIFNHRDTEDTEEEHRGFFVFLIAFSDGQGGKETLIQAHKHRYRFAFHVEPAGVWNYCMAWVHADGRGCSAKDVPAGSQWHILVPF